jgi:hypothetical protein
VLVVVKLGNVFVFVPVRMVLVVALVMLMFVNVVLDVSVLVVKATVRIFQKDVVVLKVFVLKVFLFLVVLVRVVQIVGVKVFVNVVQVDLVFVMIKSNIFKFIFFTVDHNVGHIWSRSIRTWIRVHLAECLGAL